MDRTFKPKRPFAIELKERRAKRSKRREDIISLMLMLPLLYLVWVMALSF